MNSGQFDTIRCYDAVYTISDGELIPQSAGKKLFFK
jgi:hypothetical protein